MVEQKLKIQFLGINIISYGEVEEAVQQQATKTNEAGSTDLKK